MKDYKIFLISFVLLVFMIGAVSATDGDDILSDDNSGVFVPEESILGVDGDDGGNIKEIYVKITGNDSNDGSENSPYVTIGRAVEDVTEADEAIIYIGEGIYSSDGDSNFIINMAHQYNGNANLKFIGAGANKTIIDGQSAFKFGHFDYATNITLKDISFVNFKGNEGGAVKSNGILNVENCIFKDCYSTSGTGGAISSGSDDYNWDDSVSMSLNVKNSQFIACSVNSEEGWSESRGGGAIFAGGLNECYLENNTFVSTSVSENWGNGVAVFNWMSNSKIINNKFINLTGYQMDAAIYCDAWMDTAVDIFNNTFINCSNTLDQYSIVYLGFSKYNLENNTFINSSNSNDECYYTYALDFISGLKYSMDRDVINVTNYEINNGAPVSINVLDDNKNKFGLQGSPNFKINLENENKSYTLSVSNNKIIFNAVPENGIYNLSISDSFLGIMNVTVSNDPIDLYVSPEGDDADEGTIDAPFATIQHAIDVGFEKSFNVVVHLLKGTYFGDGNVELNIANKGNLQLIGEAYNETIIDGNGESGLLRISTESTIKNLKFVNAVGTAVFGNEKVTLVDCIVDNNNAEGDCVLFNVNMDNLTFTNNYGYIYLSKSVLINNSYFANNYNEYGSGGVFYIEYIFEPVTFENCKFINNTAGENGGAIYIEFGRFGFSIKNCYFEGNYAQNGGVIYVPAENAFLTFENNTFVNNKAENNGVIGFDIVNYDVYHSPALVFDDCKFISNSAVNAGVSTLKIGIFSDCSFINNTADYGGALVVLPYCLEPEEPVYIDPDEEEAITSLEFNNVVFENNLANINGNDIYLREINSFYDLEWGEYQYIPLTITFNDLNVTTLAAELTANVSGPCGSVIGAADDLTFELNGTKIGSAKIINGVSIFKYVGFEDGEYVLSGSSFLPNKDTVTNDGTVIVKLENIVDHIEFWISPEGSDENGNGSEENPFKSISYAVTEASKSSRDIVIHIGEGNYTGDLNTALGLSSMCNLTLAGAGVDNTIIDGENNTYFATITDGPNKVTISDLTIKNMLPDNRKSFTIDSTSPITILEGGNLLLDNVAMVDNHGGKAIIVNNGNLAIDNSQFRRNGFTSWGIIAGGSKNNYKNTPIGGNVTINNSIFEDNFAQFSFVSGDNIFINNSEFKNDYDIGMGSWAWDLSFDVINYNANSIANVTIENTKISNDGSVEDLNGLGVNTLGKFVNPALSINGNLNMNNCTLANNYNGTLNTDQQVADIAYLSVLGYSYGQSRIINVVNSSFYNYQYIWVSNSGYHNFTFDGCLFTNLEYIAYLRNVWAEPYVFNDCVFLNCTPVIRYGHNYNEPNPTKLNFNDNYWGNNTPSTIIFLGNRGIIRDENCTPDTWIALYSEDDVTVIKNVTDGENSTAYTGNAPIRVEYADNRGMLDYAVVFDDIGYLFTTDNETNVILDAENPIYPFEAADPMDYRTNVYIVICGFEGDNVVIGMLVDPVGNPIVNATITSTFEASASVNTTTDENGIFKTQGGKNGILSIVYAGDDYYFDSEYNLTFVDSGVTAESFIVIDAVKDGLVVEGSLIDDEGSPIADALITLVLGNETFNTTTDANGSFKAQGVKDGVLYIVYDGDDTHLGTVYEFTFENAGKTTKSFININVIKDDLVVEATLVDDEGTLIANATVSYTIGNETFNTTTDANGVFEFNGVSNGTVLIEFAGTETADAVNATLTFKDVATETVKVESHFDIENRAITITGYAVDTAAGEEGMYYATTLLDANGSPIANAYIEFAVNNKIYNRTTYENGSFDPYKLNMVRAGRYTMAFNFAGDENYTNAFACVCVDLDKKPITIKASAKSYKASVKTKKFTATLTTIAGSSHDGKVYLSSGKKVTLTVNGKTFTGKTGTNGKVTFKITNLKKKGKYTAKISFEGDKTYDSAEKSVKLTIK